LHIARCQNGAFAQYVAAKADLCIKLPDSWGFEDAAQLPVAMFTACQCLYQTLKLPRPIGAKRATCLTRREPLIVYGASSSVGVYVTQLAVLSGYTVYATCSERNFSFVRSLGAYEVFDYKDSDVSAKLKLASGGKAVCAVDCISEGDSSAIVANAMSTAGGKIAAVLERCKSPRDEIEIEHSLAYDFIEDVSHCIFGFDFVRLLIYSSVRGNPREFLRDRRMQK
jgi:NADPH:quinone reductase-like Zn-dependent oxidoreductase